LAQDFASVPIPRARPNLLNAIVGQTDIDNRARDLFAFKEAEWVLIDDLVNITLADFKGNADSPGRRATNRGTECEMKNYCDFFCRVLQAGFGKDKKIGATIFQESRERFAYRLVAFQLEQAENPGIHIQKMEGKELLEQFKQLNKRWTSINKSGLRTIYHKRIARIYDLHKDNVTVFMVKPDAVRYWTRSAALHDADEVSADILSWARSKRQAGSNA
jgi:hypothetical protein